MHGGDVGETYHPFGVVGKRQAGKAVQDVYHAVAAARAQHGAHLGVGEGGGHVGIPFVGGAAEVAVRAKCMRHHFGAPSLLFEHSHGSCHFSGVDRAGG